MPIVHLQRLLPRYHTITRSHLEKPKYRKCSQIGRMVFEPQAHFYYKLFRPLSNRDEDALGAAQSAVRECGCALQRLQKEHQCLSHPHHCREIIRTETANSIPAQSCLRRNKRKWVWGKQMKQKKQPSIGLPCKIPDNTSIKQR